MHGSKLYVGNLNYSVTDSDLEALFSTYGVVKDVKLIEGKGFAFVELSTTSEAEAAKDALHDTDFKGRKLNIDEAKPQKPREDRGGYGGGGGRRY